MTFHFVVFLFCFALFISLCSIYFTCAVFADCLSLDSWLLLLTSISLFFGLLLLLSLPLSPALISYFVYFPDLILFTIFLFFWSMCIAWMFHSSSSKQVIPFRTASLSLAVCHSRRVPPFSFLLAPLFFRSFSLLLRSPPFFFARSKAPPFLAVPHSSSSWFLFFVFFPFDRSYSSLSFFFPLSPGVWFFSAVWAQT